MLPLSPQNGPRLLVFVQSVPNLPEQRLVPLLLLAILVKREADGLQPLLGLLSRVPHNIRRRDGVLDEPDPSAAVQGVSQKRERLGGGHTRPAQLPRMIPGVRRGLEFGLVLVQGQPRGVVPVGIGDDGPAVVGGGPEGCSPEFVVEGGPLRNFWALVSFVS